MGYDINTYKCHQVSQVLLRQFAKDKQVTIFSKDGSISRNIPGNIGHIREDKALYKATEERWGRVENRFNRMLASIEDGSVFDKPILNKTVRQLITLHFVRSIAIQKLFLIQSSQSFNELIAEHGAQGMDVAEVRKKWESDLEIKRLEFIIDAMTKIQVFVDSCYLEIAEAPRNTGFILGDNPVINLRLDGPSGVVQGVGITSSDVIFLPVSQRFVASLTRKSENSGYHLFTPKDVQLLNKKTRNQSIKEFYAKPL